MPLPSCLRLVFNLVGLGMIIVGCALQWNATRKEEDKNLISADIARARNYQIVGFGMAYLTTAAILFLRASEHSLGPTAAFSFYLGAGIMFYLAVVADCEQSPTCSLGTSFEAMDTLRILIEDQYTGDIRDWARQRIGGLVLCHVGSIFALVSAMQGFVYDSLGSCIANFRVATLLASLLSAFIGVIVLWSSDAANLGASTRENVWFICSSTLWIVLLTFIATLTGERELSSSTSVLIGAFGMWYLVLMFQIRDVVNRTPSLDDDDSVIAGTAFCWFALLLCLVVAVLVYRHPGIVPAKRRRSTSMSQSQT
eukprot:m.111580 g.111580  ORF g.111580 m.111580 type:complete len:311 (-) comp16122_c0_seq2:182-1114(-)